MTGTGIPAALAILDELYAHLRELGAPGRRLIEQTAPWRDAVARAQDIEWALYYANAVGANLASGLDWQLSVDEERAHDLLNEFLGIVRATEPSPWDDVELRQWQAQQGIGPGEIRSEPGRPPAH